MKENYIKAGLFLAVILVMTMSFKTCMTAFRKTAEVPLQTLEKANSIRRSFLDVLHVEPRITQNNTILLEQTSPIAEFAVLERTFTSELTWKHQWLGSTKEIFIRSQYIAKAGFDLHELFLIHIDSLTGKITATLPKAKILSLTRQGSLEFRDEDGWWNKVQPAERQRILNTFEEQARKQATESGILEQAEKEALKQLQKLADKNRTDATFIYRLPEAR